MLDVLFFKKMISRENGGIVELHARLWIYPLAICIFVFKRHTVFLAIKTK